MLHTTFLDKIDRDFASRTFTSRNVINLAETKLNPHRYSSINSNVVGAAIEGRFRPFEFTKGGVELKETNFIYDMELLPERTDLVLPKNPNLNDWVLLWYNQDTISNNFYNEVKQNIKIYGNGRRIMGYDEPLLCDVAFLTLRLTFIGNIEGWVVV